MKPVRQALVHPIAVHHTTKVMRLWLGFRPLTTEKKGRLYTVVLCIAQAFEDAEL